MENFPDLPTILSVAAAAIFTTLGGVEFLDEPDTDVNTLGFPVVPIPGVGRLNLGTLANDEPSGHSLARRRAFTSAHDEPSLGFARYSS